MSADLPAPSAKRAQSEESTREQSPKRRRVSHSKQSSDEHHVQSVAVPAKQGDGEAPTEKNLVEEPSPQDTSRTTQAKTTSAAGRGKSGKLDEKQRSRRLFGSLLGTLGQQGADRTIKRRQEIENRRKAELQRQDNVRAEDQHRDVEQLTLKRKSEQWRVDEEDMRIRHRSMRNAAKFLQTEALPRLYYRPWDLRPDEEQIIKAQGREVEDRIDDEADEFESRRRRAVGDEGPTNGTKPDDDHTMHNAIDPEQEGKPDGQKNERYVEAAAETGTATKPEGVPEDSGQTLPTPENDNNDASINTTTTRQQEAGAQDGGEDEDGGHMIEREEDTVIY